MRGSPAFARFAVSLNILRVRGCLGSPNVSGTRTALGKAATMELRAANPNGGLDNRVLLGDPNPNPFLGAS